MSSIIHVNQKMKENERQSNQFFHYLHHDDWSTISIQIDLYTGQHVIQVPLYILHVGCGIKKSHGNANCTFLLMSKPLIKQFKSFPVNYDKFNLTSLVSLR